MIISDMSGRRLRGSRQPRIKGFMGVTSAILTEPLAGLRAQALGLAEAAGWEPGIRTLMPRFPWRNIPPAWWPMPLRSVESNALLPPLPDVLIGCGGKSAAVLSGLRHRTNAARVIVQHPRMNPNRFDLVVAARHDEIAGPNVIVTRNALHRATPGRLAAEAALWRPRLAQIPRPLVCVLVGGSNGRYRLDRAEARAFADGLAAMMRTDGVGVALTTSRRTDHEVAHILEAALSPLGAWVWRGDGENPYFGLLGLADAIVVTMDSVSMISEAAATAAPLLLQRLPGHSRRIERFVGGMIEDNRARYFRGRMEDWAVEPLDDTAAAAHEMRRRLGL